MRSQVKQEMERWSDLGWCAVAFAVTSSGVLGLQAWAEAWLIPSWSSDVAVHQLAPSDRAAESMRLLELWRSELPYYSAWVMVLIGTMLFVPWCLRTPRGFCTCIEASRSPT